MTQAASRNTTVADAILALINSQPRTPTREEIMGAIANCQPATNSWPDYPSRLPPLLRPTELGRELMEELMPAYLEAVRYISAIEDDDPDAAELEAWEEETCHAYWGRMRDATNLVDMAIAARMAMDGETPDERLKMAQAQWEAYDRHEGYARPESVDEIVGTGALVTHRLVCAILSMAGIDEARCSEAAVYKALDGGATPTQAERKAVLARLRAQQEAA